MSDDITNSREDILAVASNQNSVSNPPKCRRRRQAPASLEMILPHVDVVLSRLPELFISSAQLVQISINLRNIQTKIRRAIQRATPVGTVQSAYEAEWQIFFSNLMAIVQSDEFRNAREFCENELRLIDRTVDKIRAKRASFSKSPQLTQSFQTLETSLLDAKNALGADFPNLPKFLQLLTGRFQLSDGLLKFATATQSELVVAKRTLLNLIELMHQYIQNAENAKAQRRQIETFCRDQNAEILRLFSEAGKEERNILSQKQKAADPRRDRGSVRKIGKIPESGGPSSESTKIVRRKEGGIRNWKVLIDGNRNA
jgi:hypothetical protein